MLTKYGLGLSFNSIQNHSWTFYSFNFKFPFQPNVRSESFYFEYEKGFALIFIFPIFSSINLYYNILQYIRSGTREVFQLEQEYQINKLWRIENIFKN